MPCSVHCSQVQRQQHERDKDVARTMVHNIPYKSQLTPAATADEKQVQEELVHAQPAGGHDGAGAGAPPGAGAPATSCRRKAKC